VVIGYGTTKKKDLTGAVTNIGEKDFNQGVLANPIQQIQGKVAGWLLHSRWRSQSNAIIRSARANFSYRVDKHL
jgi:hypothetical protein